MRLPIWSILSRLSRQRSTWRGYSWRRPGKSALGVVTTSLHRSPNLLSSFGLPIAHEQRVGKNRTTRPVLTRRFLIFKKNYWKNVGNRVECIVGWNSLRGIWIIPCLCFFSNPILFIAFSCYFFIFVQCATKVPTQHPDFIVLPSKEPKRSTTCSRSSFSWMLVVPRSTWHDRTDHFFSFLPLGTLSSETWYLMSSPPHEIGCAIFLFLPEIFGTRVRKLKNPIENSSKI